MTKALKVSVEGEVPSLADLDLARVGLGASPKAPLPLGKVGPLEPGRADGDGLISSILFLLFVSPLFCVVDVFFLFFSLGSSSYTLSGWVEHLNALYKEIGGC